MKLNSYLHTAIITAIVTLGTAFATSEGWTSDFEAAKKQATKENKFLLINFTGSDWCGYCIKLKKDVFSDDAFNQGVKDKFILVELDFPKKPENISNLSEAVIAQNKALEKTYAVNKGFPTIYLTDAQGKPFAKTGFLPVSGKTYVKHLNALLAMRETTESAFADAKNREGDDKAKSLIFALQSMGLNDDLISTFYPDVHADIIASSPDAAKKLEMQKTLKEFQDQLNELGSKKDHEGAIKLIDEALAAGKFEGEIKQQTMIFKSLALMQLKKPQDALQVLDDAKAVSPQSPFVAQIEGIKKKIEASIPK